MAGSFKNIQQRIGALLRVISLLCIIFGGLFAYFISQTSLIPQLVPILYFLAALLIFVGATVLIAKFE
ncbi:MAG: hypothetical protein ACYC7D_02730 [Nitrososphaerales archaeon]